MFLGRQLELRLLDEAWGESGRIHIAVLSAAGGIGKTSLVSRWLEGLKTAGWGGAARVYAWSFYDQGAHGDRQTSDDQFLVAMLRWFEIDHDASTSSWDKGLLLANALSRQRTLLILDGVEPLQHPPGPLSGKLRAPGVESLLLQLARGGHPGLCLITSREAIQDLQGYVRSSDHPAGTVLAHVLDTLSDEDGGRLLHRLGVRRSGAALIDENDAELRQASHELRGHALALTLLGNYLRLAYNGNVRQRDRVTFERANKETCGDAGKALAAYEEWFQQDQVWGRRLLAAVQLLGFFDRPADPTSLRSLCEPPIQGLTEPLADITTADWNTTRSRLEETGLVRASDQSGAIDAHPLVRAYFARQLRAKNLTAWREGHRRLYRYLCSIVPEQPESLADVSVLLRAVLHGCEAGEYRHALVGRLEEALGPFEVAFNLYSKLSDLSHAALSGRYLTELYMTVGRLSEAITWGQRARACADKAVDAYEQMAESSTLGRALFRFGRFTEAERAFVDAEHFRGYADVSQYRYWYFCWEFDLCELLISQGRYAEAWERVNAALRDIKLTGESLIATSQIHLAVGRVLLERGASEDLATASPHIEQAVQGLRKAGHPLYLMDGLLARALLRGRQGNLAAVKAELGAAWDIAERAAMRLAMADILLLRARLLEDRDANEEARQKIAQLNYGRHAAGVQEARGN
jgi:tetratricopeptide (TPR) repeat protein